MSKDIIDIGKKIINVEIQGLQQLEASLDAEFVQACELIKSCKGRVIVTGMGKSGHVANKIAATLASTGTPAFFVHPAEALHGDLGMITKEDIVLALSNSGYTAELSGIINYIIRFGIDLIAITKNKDSELGKAATIVLLLPQAEEACSLGLAPTTSTTNSLALGDAIAITLLELKGFSSEDFKVFHPGGALGTKLIKVAEVMHKGEELPLINENATMDQAIIEITSHRFGCVGIINKDQDLIGIITDGDIRRHMADNFLNQSVQDVMTKSFITITAQENTSHVLKIMNEKKITALFVVENEKPVGIIHIHDLLILGVV